MVIGSWRKNGGVPYIDSGRANVRLPLPVYAVDLKCVLAQRHWQAFDL